jgi:hypothetical protein
MSLSATAGERGNKFRRQQSGAQPNAMRPCRRPRSPSYQENFDQAGSLPLRSPRRAETYRLRILPSDALPRPRHRDHRELFVVNPEQRRDKRGFGGKKTFSPESKKLSRRRRPFQAAFGRAPGGGKGAGRLVAKQPQRERSLGTPGRRRRGALGNRYMYAQ